MSSQEIPMVPRRYRRPQNSREIYIGNWGDFDMYISDVDEPGRNCKLILQLGHEHEARFLAEAYLSREEVGDPWVYMGQTTLINPLPTRGSDRLRLALVSFNEHAAHTLDVAIRVAYDAVCDHDGDAMERLVQ